LIKHGTCAAYPAFLFYELKKRKRTMNIKLTTLLGIAACALASTPGFAQPPHHSHGALIAEENGMSGNETRDSTVQKQTDPRKNGTSQSESKDGSNKNGQPQK
jgi:hypothetical protein